MNFDHVGCGCSSESSGHVPAGSAEATEEMSAGRDVTRRDLLRAGAIGGIGAAGLIGPFGRGVAPAFGLGERARSAYRSSSRARALRRPDWPQPTVRTRAEWGANELLRRPGQVHELNVTKLIVHHTVTPNSPADPAAVVRSIYADHTRPSHPEQYIDLAYHWLIDQHGTIYEGRWARDYPAGVPHSGDDVNGSQVRGAHALHTNTSSCGIAMLGTFTSGVPTEAAIESLVSVLAWKCARWGIDPEGADTYVDGRTFPNICGHRDASSTACPGGPLHAKLPEIRQRVANRLKAGENGYWITSTTGTLAFGDLPDLGDPRRVGLRPTIRAIVGHPTQLGYWMLGSDGGVFSYGSAGFFGSTGGMRLNQPIVGMAPSPSGNGYWLCASDGGIFNYGDAQFLGSTGASALPPSIIDIAATATGAGYWLLARDGEIFAFGDAPYLGSAAGKGLQAVGFATRLKTRG